MGIFDIFKKKSNENIETKDYGDKENMDKANGNSEQNLVLNYKSGDQATVVFKDMEEIEGKMLQKAIVWYGRHDKENAVIEGKDLLLEPHVSRNENGELAYDTEKYYTSLAQNGKMGAVKGFFQKEQVNPRETNYIGILDFNEDGRATRKEDDQFLNKYKEIYKAKQERIEREKQERKEAWKKEMQNQTNNIHESISNPDDYNVVLTPDMLDEYDEFDKTIGKIESIQDFIAKKKKEEQEGNER